MSIEKRVNLTACEAEDVLLSIGTRLIVLRQMDTVLGELHIAACPQITTQIQRLDKLQRKFTPNLRRKHR